MYFTYSSTKNTCEFLSNGDGTYTFQSGTGFVGGNNEKVKALVVENGKLVFKQNFYETINKLWDKVGFAVTFDTSENTYSIWKGSNETFNPTLSSVEVNGTKIDVYAAGTTPPAPAGTVIPNEGMTAAEFVMPGYDLKLEYEMSRDMAQNMSMKVGETGEDDFVIRVKKNEQGEGYVPAEMDVQQVIALFKVHDGIENKDLTFYGAEAVCALSIYAADDNDLPTGDAITFADLEPGRYVAVATAADRYAFNGKQFVWVKNAIDVAANKAWLQISNTNARTITLVFDETTGVNAVDNGQLTIDNDGWYDLNGRKLEGMPTRKGVYILNGRKEVVK